MKEIAIVDYNLGNITSIRRALSFLGYKSIITNNPEIILKSEKVILPGVGAFPTAMSYLKKYDLIEAINETVKKGNDILGICLGMQLLMQFSNEFERTKGLSLIEGDVISINDILNDNIKLPCIGWYKLNKTKENAVLKNIKEDQWFYFVHSYRMLPVGLSGKRATCSYGVEFLAAYEQDNIFATQFHPEKSQSNGLMLLKNFLVQ